MDPMRKGQPPIALRHFAFLTPGYLDFHTWPGNKTWAQLGFDIKCSETLF